MPESNPFLFFVRMPAYSWMALCVGAMALASVAGCVQRTPAVRPPSYQSSKISAAAFNLLDLNKDSQLDDKELAKAPGLKVALARIDSNKDGLMAAEELEARVAEYRNAHVGLRNETYTFTLNGAPLSEARVVFTPEACFEDTLQAADGQTGATGSTSVKISGNKIPGLTCGMYQVSVSKKDASGKELLPAKYNTETTLGYEFSPQESTAEKDRAFTLTTR